MRIVRKPGPDTGQWRALLLQPCSGSAQRARASGGAEGAARLWCGPEQGVRVPCPRVLCSVSGRPCPMPVVRWRPWRAGDVALASLLAAEGAALPRAVHSATYPLSRHVLLLPAPKDLSSATPPWWSGIGHGYTWGFSAREPLSPSPSTASTCFAEAATSLTLEPRLHPPSMAFC